LRTDDLPRLVRERGRFLSGAIEQGTELRFAERVLDTLMAVRIWGESRGHVMAQALVCYRTAWLLTHHPLATLVELLNHSMGQSARQQRVIRMAVDHGCRILKVDVNRSEEGYLIEDGAIRLAISHVPSVGEATAAALVAARSAGGGFDSVQDVLLRVPSLHRLQVDALADAGAFAALRDSRLAVDRDAAVHRRGAVPRRSRGSRRATAQMILEFDGVGACQNSRQPADPVDPKPLADEPAVPASPARQRDSRGGRPMTRAVGGRIWLVGTLFGRGSVARESFAPGSGLGKSVEEV
jgi:DNA polymerase III alpha subunit